MSGGVLMSMACNYNNHGVCNNRHCLCKCHTTKEESPMAETQPVPFHKAALLGLLKAHPERATTVLEKLIGGLPDSLEYSDISSTDLAEEMLVALTTSPTYTLVQFDRCEGVEKS